MRSGTRCGPTRGCRAWGSRTLRSSPRGAAPSRSASATRPQPSADELHLAQRGEAAERLDLDLADALTRETEPAADLLERLRLGVLEPVAQDEDAPLAFGEDGERVRKRLATQRRLDLLLGEWAVALDEVAEDRVLLVTDRLVEARRRSRGRLPLVCLVDGEGRLLGDLLERRLAAELRPECPLGAIHLLEPLDDVDGHADRPRLVRKGTRHGLADPPGRVGRKLIAAAPVELLDGANEPERAFLNEVEEGETLVAVVLRDRDDEAQVRLDHVLLRVRVAALDALRELDLLRGGQQRVAPGLAQEELQ